VLIEASDPEVHRRLLGRARIGMTIGITKGAGFTRAKCIAIKSDDVSEHSGI
jgi:hypothetical protein